jgi:hypothetical protein
MKHHSFLAETESMDHRKWGLHYCMFLLLGSAILAPYNARNKIRI